MNPNFDFSHKFIKILFDQINQSMQFILRYKLLIELFYKFCTKNILYSILMDNYLIIDDVDICFIEQNSWIILLEKQIIRNTYLLKLHETDKHYRKIKINLKDIYSKVKQSINKNIKSRIKNRKNYQKIPNLNQSACASISLRRKTQELPLQNKMKLSNRNNSNSPPALQFQTSQYLNEYKKSRYINQPIKSHLNFLPFQPSSIVLQKDIKSIKNNSTKLLQTKLKLQKPLSQSKPLSQAKPILSLHELEFNTKQLFLGQNITFHKRMTHIEKLLIRSSINSPKNRCLNTSKDEVTINTKYDELAEIGRYDSQKLCMSEFMYRIQQLQKQLKDKSLNCSKKTQQTKQSESDNIYGLESIIEYCASSSYHKTKEQSFEDYHITKSNLMKNYRISKIKNINFPVK